MKKLIIALLYVLSNSAFAQSLNDYKYALVPDKFEAIRKGAMPRLNAMTKLYMQKYGFETYLASEQQSIDFANTNCNKVYVDVVTNNGLFSTKVAIVIKDCRGIVLATSPFGSSLQKDLSVAYVEALKDAFDKFTQLQSHQYSHKILTDSNTAVIVPAKMPETRQERLQETSAQATPSPQSADLLYAQPIQNGFQLVNSEPRVVYKIYKTSNSDIYAAVKGNISGVFIPKGNEWFFEYYQNDQLVSEKVNVKF